MRVLIVCALVAGGFLYYMKNQDSTPSYSGSNLSHEALMAKCRTRKAKEYSTHDTSGASMEATCASEVKGEKKRSSKYGPEGR